MPTLKTLRLNEDQQQPVQPVTVDKIITRFPYKEFGMAQNGKNGSLTVTLPNGMKIHMLAPAIKYYTEIMGDGKDRKDEYVPAMQLIDQILSSDDIARNTENLKSVSRHFSDIEYRPEKYSFVAYLLNASNLDVPGIKKIYMAYASDDMAGLAPDQRGIYDAAVKYCAMYYKFLIGLLAVA